MRNIEEDDYDHVKYRGAFKIIDINSALTSVKLNTRIKTATHSVILRIALIEILALSLNYRTDLVSKILEYIVIWVILVLHIILLIYW